MKAKKNSRPHLKAEDFYSILSIQDPRLHPAGELAVYVKTSPENEGKSYKRQIFIIDLKTQKESPVSSGAKGGDSSPRWSPDGQKLGFISGRSEKSQFYILENQWGEARSLTSVANGVQMAVWSEQSDRIAFLARTRKEERQEEDHPSGKQKTLTEKEKKRLADDRKDAEEMRIDPRIYRRTVFRQGTVYKDDRNTHIYIQGLKDQKAKRLTDGTCDFGPMSWTPDGKFIVSSTNMRVPDPDVDVRTDLVKIDIKTKAMQFLTDDENGNFFPQVCPTGRWIYYFSFQNSERYKQRMRIRRIPVEGGQPQEILPDYDFDPHYFQLDTKGEWLYFAVSHHGRDSIAKVSVNGGVPEFVVRFDGMVNEFHLHHEQLIYSAEAPDMPSDLFVMPLKSNTKGNKGESVKQGRRLTRLNETFLKKRTLSKPHEIWLDRPDGTKVQGWYMLPDGYRKGRRYPWVVQVHGGPHIMWGWSFWHEFQSMCSRGYGVYFSNPRGSDGYGSEFKGAIHLKWGDEDSQDILAGIDRMVEMGLADPDKLFLTGGSFGGFMTGWIVTHDDRFKAVVAQRGVYNFISMYGASDALTLIEWEFDTLPWKNPELLWDRSPLKYVQNVTTPTMVLHSEQDFRVGISQAEEFYTALKREGKVACLVRYPREGHELSRSGEPKHRVDRINRIIGWFDEHMPKD